MRGDTYRYGNLFSSSPAVGFWAVIAVSGGVALLTFGKKRLWSHHHHHNPYPYPYPYTYAYPHQEHLQQKEQQEEEDEEEEEE